MAQPISRTRRAGSGRKRSRSGVAARARSDTRAQADGVNVAGVTLSHPKREVYPELGLTKLDVARYYEATAEWLLPHFRDRPLSLLRCPENYHRCFFQKHIERNRTYPAVGTVPVREGRGVGHYPVIDSLEGVISLVQLSTLEFHSFGVRRDRLEQPDRITLDLDPGPQVTWPRVAGAARMIRELLTELGLASFVKTTGGKGLHVVVPLQRRRTWDDVLAFSRAVAEMLVKASPREYTIAQPKARRQNKIFVDYLRNARGAIAVEAYSVRARVGAPVATPIHWDELSASLRPERLNLKTVPKRLASLGADTWEGYASVRQSITAKMLASVGVRD